MPIGGYEREKMITEEITAEFLKNFKCLEYQEAGFEDRNNGYRNYIMKIANCDEWTANELISKYNLGTRPPTPEQVIAVEQYEAQKANTPKCPTCGSTNVKKISVTAKVIGAVGFGLFSKTARSQFKCDNCGYKW